MTPSFRFWLAGFVTLQIVSSHASEDYASNGDIDGDGISNLMEFATGTDPAAVLVPQAGAPIKINANFLKFTYTRNIAALDVISFQVERSETLAAWNSQGVNERVLSNDEAIQTMEATIPLISPACFVRLKVTSMRDFIGISAFSGAYPGQPLTAIGAGPHVIYINGSPVPGAAFSGQTWIPAGLREGQILTVRAPGGIVSNPITVIFPQATLRNEDGSPLVNENGNPLLNES